jgi:hypothetical protein
MSKSSIGSTITILLSSISLAILFVIVRDHLVVFDSYETAFSTDIGGYHHLSQQRLFLRQY